MFRSLYIDQLLRPSAFRSRHPGNLQRPISLKPRLNRLRQLPHRPPHPRLQSTLLSVLSAISVLCVKSFFTKTHTAVALPPAGSSTAHESKPIAPGASG